MGRFDNVSLAQLLKIQVKIRMVDLYALFDNSGESIREA
jgi:hypothetical protein